MLDQFSEPRLERRALALMQLFLAEDIGRFEHHDLEPFRPAMFDERGQRRSKIGRGYQDPLSGRVIRRTGEPTPSEDKQDQHASQPAPRANNQGLEAQEHKAHLARSLTRENRRSSLNPEALVLRH